MFDDAFSHYAAYGSTDQKTVREISQKIDGLLVPGTVAAFQREGTGGFVLTLSAHTDLPYLIDPRFPLFQQQLPAPKKSHKAIAAIVGIDELLENHAVPTPDFFTQQRIDEIGKSWAQFNLIYKKKASAKFEKYAKRLGEELEQDDASAPSHILPPYFMCESTNDPWWIKSKNLYDSTANASENHPCLRVVASKTPQELANLVQDTDSTSVAIWVNNLNELLADHSTLTSYGAAIRGIRDQGVQTFALYGGFFSVLLHSVGLGGSSHGIGFGESREYLELPQSGPPPSRFYLPRLHRYISQELAFQLWQALPSLAECGCEVCEGSSPISLRYHDLMKHSVLCRAQEIEDWAGLAPKEIEERLTFEAQDFYTDLEDSSVPELLRTEAKQYSGHLRRWSSAFANL